jgi:hypothetical protein
MSIGCCACQQCSQLNSVATIFSRVIVIGDSAFHSETYLTQIEATSPNFCEQVIKRGFITACLFFIHTYIYIHTSQNQIGLVYWIEIRTYWSVYICNCIHACVHTTFIHTYICIVIPWICRKVLWGCCSQFQYFSCNGSSAGEMAYIWVCVLVRMYVCMYVCKLLYSVCEYVCELVLVIFDVCFHVVSLYVCMFFLGVYLQESWLLRPCLLYRDSSGAGVVGCGGSAALEIEILPREGWAHRMMASSLLRGRSISRSSSPLLSPPPQRKKMS